MSDYRCVVRHVAKQGKRTRGKTAADDGGGAFEYAFRWYLQGAGAREGASTHKLALSGSMVSCSNADSSRTWPGSIA